MVKEQEDSYKILKLILRLQ